MSWLAIIGCFVGVLVFAAIMTWLTVHIIMTGVCRGIETALHPNRTNKDGGAK